MTYPNKMSGGEVSLELDAALWATAKLGFPLDEIQRMVLERRPHRLILNCHRQWGKSTLTSLLAVHRAVYHPGVEVVVVSRTLEQSAEWLRKAERICRQLGLKVRGDGYHKRALVLENGSRLIALAGNPESNYGYTSLALLVFEEASRVKEAMWDALTPTLGASNGDLFLISTPCGQGGFFHREWMFGEDYMRVMVTAEQSGRIPADFLRRARASNERAYRQDFLCEFLEGDAAWLDRETIERAFRDDIKPLDL